MDYQDVVWYVEGKGKSDGERMKEFWKMTRRLAFILARTMGGYKGDEKGLWPIDENKKPVTKGKIEEWKKRIKELGK